MAFDNTEIEVKFSISSKQDFLRLRAKLEKKGKFVKKTSHQDLYFNPPHKDFLSPKYPYEWLSIRKRDDKVKINYKHWYPEDVEDKSHCDEYEFFVSDFNSTRSLFSSLGYTEIVEVNKTREVFELDGFEIGLDIAEGLGFFVEIEAVQDFGSVEKTREKIFELAEELEVDISRVDSMGYPKAPIDKHNQ